MMANDYSRFNAEPIMLCHSSSRATADDRLMMDTYESQHYSSDDDEPVVVRQTLDVEQKNYEFPPRARLRELSYLDDDYDSFFDESSFSTSESDYYQHFRRPASADVLSDEDDNDDEDDDHQMLLVDDSRLSPLQLPARASCSPRRPRARELSCDSTATVTQSPHHHTDPVGPSSFLKQPSCNRLEGLEFPKNRVTQGGRRVSPCHGLLSRLDSDDDLDLPVFSNESEPVMDDFSDNDSDIHCDSKIVLIKLNTKHKMKKPLDNRQHCYSSSNSSSYHVSDEGYEEDFDDEPPIESVSVFLPLSDEEQEHMLDRDLLRNAAATRIQAAWRGYRSRKTQNNALKPAQRVVVDLARICTSMHGRQMARMNRRMEALEQRIREEQAMRIAFEKAMEDMTILIDQQQKMLSDRIDGEIAMRESYELKMAQVEGKLRKETKARNDLEDSMTQVLVQVQDMQQAQQRQQKEDADAKKAMRRKLDETQQEIALLKRHQQPSTRSRTGNAAPKTSSASSSSTASSSTTKASTSVRGRPTHTNNNNTTTTTTTTTSTLRRTVVPSSRPSSQAAPTPQSRAASRMDSSSRRPTAVPRSASQQARQQSTVTRRTTLQRR